MTARAKAAPPSREDLVDMAIDWLRKIGCTVVIDARDVPAHLGLEYDAIGWRNGISIAVVCRDSQKSYDDDIKKTFRRFPDNTIGGWRFYLVSPGEIHAHNLPPLWGLLSAINGKVISCVNVPINRMRWSNDLPFVVDKSEEIILLCSAIKQITNTTKGK